MYAEWDSDALAYLRGVVNRNMDHQIALADVAPLFQDDGAAFGDAAGCKQSRNTLCFERLHLP